MSLVCLTLTPADAFPAVPEPVALEKTNPEMPERVKVLLNRLDEIKAMDRSSMSRAEKKALRKEVREIKTELRTTSNGIYLSVGAIIIIILLLILIL